MHAEGIGTLRNKIFLGLFPLFASCAPAMEPAANPAANSFSAVLINGSAKVMTPEEAVVGLVELSPSNAGAIMSLKVTGLSAGTYAIHLHETGKCEGPDYKSAGGHWNPGGRQHGLENPNGTHSGDLPNIVAANGRVTRLKLTLPGLKLNGQGGLMDADGAAFIIHAGPDDNKTDPSGNSGARVICGVFAAKSSGK